MLNHMQTVGSYVAVKHFTGDK